MSGRIELKRLLLRQEICPFCNKYYNVYLVKVHYDATKGYCVTGIGYAIQYSCSCHKFGGALTAYPSRKQKLKLFLFGEKVKWQNKK